MIVNDTHSVLCPAYNKKVTLNVGFNEKKTTPKDIAFDYRYIGFNCDFIRSGKHCPYADCPLLEKLDLLHSLHR